MGRPPPGKVELTVYVDADVRKRLRMEAAERGEPLTAIVERYVVRGLDTSARRRP